MPADVHRIRLSRIRFARKHGFEAGSLQGVGDTAHAESYCQWVHRLQDDHTVTVGGGRYIDRLERRDGAWRIAVRRLVLDYAFTTEGTVHGTPTHEAYPKGTWDRRDLSYERPLQAPGS